MDFKKILTALNTTSIVMLFFSIKQGTIAFPITNNYYINYTLSSLILIFVTIFTTYMELKKSTINKSNEKLDVIKVERINEKTEYCFLIYCLIGLSMETVPVAIITHLMIFFLAYNSKTSLCNPFFIILGYNFYRVETKNNAIITVISKENYKLPRELDELSFHRADNYTFFESKR